MSVQAERPALKSSWSRTSGWAEHSTATACAEGATGTGEPQPRSGAAARLAKRVARTDWTNEEQDRFDKENLQMDRNTPAFVPQHLFRPIGEARGAHGD